MLEEQICGLHSSLQCIVTPIPHCITPCLPARTTMGAQNDGKFCWPAHHGLPLVIFKFCRIALTLANFWNATNISPAEANIRIIFMTHGIQSLESLDFIKPKLSNYYMNYNIYTHRGHPDWPEWRSGLAWLKRNSAMQKHRLQNFINSLPPSFVTW